MRRPSPLATFFLAAFAWSWVLWLLATRLDLPDTLSDVLIIAGRFGPTLAAIAVTLVVAGRTGLVGLLAPLRRWRAPASLWLTVTVGPIAVVLAAIGLASWFGTPPGAFNDPATAYLIIPAFVVILVVGGPLGEELGWRGFALDRLQVRFGPAAASVLLGLVWGVWHLPLFLDPSQVQSSLPLALYLGQTTTTAVIYTWLWNRTRSLPLVLVLHTMANVAAGVFPLLAPEAPDDLAFGLAVAIAGTVALVLIGMTRGRLGWRPGMASEVIVPEQPREA
jgi:membrane protease YdiL (CAAX protease family)